MECFIEITSVKVAEIWLRFEVAMGHAARMANLAYNRRRLVWHQRRAAFG